MEEHANGKAAKGFEAPTRPMGRREGRRFKVSAKLRLGLLGPVVDLHAWDDALFFPGASGSGPLLNTIQTRVAPFPDTRAPGRESFCPASQPKTLLRNTRGSLPSHDSD